MTDNRLPPPHCQWWKIGNPTPHPPEDAIFLTALANSGFRVFIAEGGLLGALHEERGIDVIHRGFGRRWRIGLQEAGKEQGELTIFSLPNYVDLVTAWLHGQTLEDALQLSDP